MPLELSVSDTTVINGTAHIQNVKNPLKTTFTHT
jgi:hypothetical protein